VGDGVVQSQHFLMKASALAPSDFCLFPKLKEFMKGHKISDDEDVICTTGWLEDQEQQFFYNGSTALEKHWTKRISVAGEYVEK